MTKSDLIERLAQKHPSIPMKEIEEVVKEMLEYMSLTLEKGQRIEVRGFGSFSLHHRKPRMGRNPKTGEQVRLNAKAVPHFKAGKALRERVDIYA